MFVKRIHAHETRDSIAVRRTPTPGCAREAAPSPEGQVRAAGQPRQAGSHAARCALSAGSRVTRA